jgi:ABC-type antimicrobial peptide transport system permease subunit
MRLTTVDEIVDATIANRRFYTIATVTFAVIAFLLTMVGLVVVIARVVAERRRELAIRAALGATAGRIARHASNDSVRSVVGGMLLGLGVAYVMSPLLGQFLFGVEVRSVITYAAVAMLMLSVAVIGVALPMRAFARLSVSEALKAD